MAYKGRFRPKHPDKYKGDSTKIIYRSLWELKVFKWMDEHRDVIWWQSEEVVVPYDPPAPGADGPSADSVPWSWPLPL